MFVFVQAASRFKLDLKSTLRDGDCASAILTWAVHTNTMLALDPETTCYAHRLLAYLRTKTVETVSASHSAMEHAACTLSHHRAVALA